jgi:erythritol kinase
MTAAVHLGIDIGTSMTKVAAFDDDGTVVAHVGRPTRLDHLPGGRVEQDTEDVVRSLAEVVAQLRTQIGDVGVDTLAVTGQGDGVWLVDQGGRSVRPAVSWMDGRAVQQLARWEADGVVDAVYRLNGCRLFLGLPAPILAWFDQHEPEALEAAATAAYCKDVVMQRLTGLRATDPTDASFPFADPSGEYSPRILELLGLSHRAELLAPIAHPLPTAPVTDAGAAEFGLPEGLPVVCGPFDLPACAAGAGLTEVGDGLLIVGTTLASLVLTDTVDTTGQPTGYHVGTVAPDRWLRAMPGMVGTASLDWVLGMLGLRHDELDRFLSGSEPGAGGVEVLPYFAPSGERAPFVDPAARGQLSGLSLSSTHHDVVRGVCEGVAYAARHCLEAAGLTGTLNVAGGGARSRGWLQIFADVLGRPLHLARQPEVGARGAVLTALELTGNAPDAKTWTRPESVVEPDPSTAARYADGYDRYLAHLGAARELWRRD